MLPKCPRCGNDVYIVLNEWEYAKFHVKNFHCKKCNKNLKVYYNHNILSHIIISRGPTKRSRILKYLKTHRNANVNKIANALRFRVKDVLEILIQMEKKGIVNSFIEGEDQLKTF
jgi:transcription initiation factor IIE alpha subunit